MSIQYNSTVGGCEYRVVAGKIERHKAHCLVNAANHMMAHGSGVARALSDADGPNMATQSAKLCKDMYGRNGVPIGSCITTKANNLKDYCKYIIHAVGPNCSNANENKNRIELLRKAVTCAINEANKLQCKSIAFPLISSGIFGMKIEEVTKTMIAAVADWRKAHPNNLIKRVDFIDLVGSKGLASMSAAIANHSGFGQWTPSRSSTPSSASREKPVAVRTPTPKSVNRKLDMPGTSYPSNSISKFTYDGCLVRVVNKDMITHTADCLVNTPNFKMEHKSELSKRLLFADGQQMQKDTKRAVMERNPDTGTLSVGDCLSTVAHALNTVCKYIIHTVGPDLNDPYQSNNYSHFVSRATRSALDDADKLSCRSIAFPLISVAPGQLKAEESAYPMVKGVKHWLDFHKNTSVQVIDFVDHDNVTIEAILPIFQELLTTRKTPEYMMTADQKKTESRTEKRRVQPPALPGTRQSAPALSTTNNRVTVQENLRLIEDKIKRTDQLLKRQKKSYQDLQNHIRDYETELQALMKHRRKLAQRATASPTARASQNNSASSYVGEQDFQTGKNWGEMEPWGDQSQADNDRYLWDKMPSKPR